MRNEPRLKLDDIQGNILLEFARISQAVICLRLKDYAEDADAVANFKVWLRRFLAGEFRVRDYPLKITTTADVYALRARLADHFRQCDLPPPRAGTRRLADPESFRLPRDQREEHTAAAWRSAAAVEGANDVWIQIGFSYACLKRIAEQVLLGDSPFSDRAFTTGMADFGALGDPETPGAPGNSIEWVVGGYNAEVRADVFLLIAADNEGLVTDTINEIRTQLAAAGAPAVAHYCEKATLIDLYTPEHFGHADGFSQPGILGLTPSGEPLTKRTNPLDPGYQGRPGQQLIWPGSFVLGYANQVQGENDPEHGDREQSLRNVAPEWARNGSYLVFRRLKQDVAAYRSYVAQRTKDLQIKDGEPHLAAMLMGRWREGVPLMRAPTRGEVVDGLKEPCTSNHFDYQAPSGRLPVKEKLDDPWCSDHIPGTTSEYYAQSGGDRGGDVCPYVGHIRKMYPRDDGVGYPPDFGTRRRQVEIRRILRRGVRYGPFWPLEREHPPDDEERGMLFLAYQASIQEQFLWLVAAANGPELPAGTPAELQGWDPIIGQNPNREDRERCFPIRYQQQEDPPESGKRPAVLATTTDWVIPRGGEYFFVPSLSGLATLSK